MAFGLGGIVSSVVNPMNLASLAMGPAGWAAIAARTIGSQIAMNVLQNLGERMGLPQQAISLAQAQFAAASGNPGLARGNLQQAISQILSGGFSAREVAQTQRQAGDLVSQMTENFLKRLQNGDDSEGGSARGKSRLVALAMALGKVMDGKMDKMIEIGGRIDKTKKTGELSAQMQALSQELNLVANALNNTIKTVGEANANMARKS